MPKGWCARALATAVVAVCAVVTAPAVPAYAAGPEPTSTSPADGEVRQDRPSHVSAGFGEALDTTPGSGSTITLARGATAVSGTQSFFNGDTAIRFTPSAPLVDGGYTATVTARDRGTPQESATSSWSFTVDTGAPPAPHIDEVPPVTAANAAGVTVSGTAWGAATVAVELRDNTGQSVHATPARDGDRYTAHLDATPLADGSVSVRVTATDEAGNSATASRTVRKDTQAPARASTVPADGEVAPAVRRVTVQWAEAFRSGSASVEVRDAAGAVRPGTATVTDRTVTLRLDAAAPAAGSPYSVVATATDVYGNTGETVTGFTVQADVAGTAVCGALPRGVTTWAATGAPYRICPEGVTVPEAATLELDGSAGPFAVVATGAGGLHADSGAIKTVQTSPVDAVTFRSATDTTGSWAGIAGTNGLSQAPGTPVLDLAHVVVRHAVSGITGVGAASEHREFRLDHVTVTDTSSHGIDLRRTASRVTAATVARAGGDGIRVACSRYPDAEQWQWQLRAGSSVVSGSTVTAAHGTGINVLYCGGQVTGNVVTGSGTASPRRPAIAVVAWASSELPEVRVDLGSPTGVSGNTGGGNGIDAVAVAGAHHGPLTWVTPVQGQAPHPLGYLNLGLAVKDATTVDFPPGSVVKSGLLPGAQHGPATGFRSGFLHLGAATVTIGEGSVFTSLRDDSAGPPTCASSLSTSCTPTRADWPGIRADGAITATGTRLGHAESCLRGPGSLSAPRANLVATRLTVHDCTQGLLTDDLTLTSSTITDIGPVPRETPLGIGAEVHGSVSVVDTTFTRVSGSALRAMPEWGTGAGTARVERVTADDTGGIELVRTWAGGEAYRGPVVRDVVVTDSSPLALRLDAEEVSAGPGRAVDRITGDRNARDSIDFDSSFTGGLTWVSVPTGSGVRPLGYAGGIHLLGGTLTVPSGARMELAELRLTGATFDARAGDITIHAREFADWEPDHLERDTRVTVDQAAATSRILLTGVTWEDFGRLDIAPRSPARPVVRIADSTLTVRDPGLTSPYWTGLGLFDADTELVRSALTGLHVHARGRLRVADSVVSSAARTGGVLVSGAGDYAVNRTRIRGSGSGGGGLGTMSGAAVTGGCNSIQRTSFGVAATATPVVTDDSDLYGNVVDAHTEHGGRVQARRVWWGQAGGPRPEQVEGSVDASSPAAAQRPKATITTSSTATRSDGSYGPGRMTVRVAFSRRMDTRVQPTVTVTGSDGKAHRVSGAWADTRVWRGAYDVTRSNAGGRNRIDASGARGCVNDPATNRMTPAAKDVRFATPPATTITAGPGAYSGTSTSFSFTAGTTARFTCSTGGAWSACTSPKRLSGLSAGRHTFWVRATNAYGTGRAASRTWTVTR